MKKILLLCACLLTFSAAFAQHGVTVKQTASAMLRANAQKDYHAYVSYFHPAELKFRGGKEQWIRVMKNNDKDSELIGILPTKQTLGKVSKCYKAGKELHCTIEWDIKSKTYLSRSHFLAISADQGKTWKFIMTAGKIPSQIWAMFPNFNEALMWSDYNEEL